ncbi:hypothetical protein ASF19_00315 [Acidovorax sp. Leaf84]|nr:hypothetical protein ASF19_00315 [Acidovorax sp. Leaf84]KQS42293.1 hypothetical protein ASG27_00310 [Acidovorax sp. Leaf191]
MFIQVQVVILTWIVSSVRRLVYSTLLNRRASSMASIQELVSPSLPPLISLLPQERGMRRG